LICVPKVSVLICENSGKNGWHVSNLLIWWPFCSTLDLFDMKYRRGSSFFYDYEMDAEDLAEILQNTRSARENADFVIVSIHAHACTNDCDDVNQPRGEGNFLKRLAHEAIDRRCQGASGRH
jgi:hypothetical protein